jgi:hypothetical protein
MLACVHADSSLKESFHLWPLTLLPGNEAVRARETRQENRERTQASMLTCMLAMLTDSTEVPGKRDR